MTSTVLGKRTRSSTNSASKSPIVKRQAREEIYNDENENPFVSTGRNGDSIDMDEVYSTVSTRSKRGEFKIKGKRADLSPSNDENSCIQIPTPQTPRHRDALSKKLPVTPRHRITIGSKALTPRTPRTPSTSSGSMSTVYSRARQLFIRSSEPGKLVGRESEKQELATFIKTHIEETSGGCIYVSGPPGTGKSAMVNETTNETAESTHLKKAYVNCMSLKTSKDLYEMLLETLCEGIDVMEGEETKALEGIFIPKKKSKNVYIITLDEIDHVLNLDLEILYKLFEWSLQKSSHLVLIGIANALDLTDRFLPRLKARNMKPHLLPFLPYTAAQIKAVIIAKLKSLVKDGPSPDYLPFLHPAAIELCSRKVSSQSGDLRKAFDICRRAIDVIEAEVKQKHELALKEQTLLGSPSKRPLEENVNFSSPVGTSPMPATQITNLAQSLSTLTPETAPRASIAHVNKITASTFGNGANQRLKTLNLQQKAALCALVALEKRKRTAAANVMATPSKSNNVAPTIKALYDVYCMLCTRDSILHPLTSTEFRDVIGNLETLSLVSAVDGRNGSFAGMRTPSRSRKFGAGIGSGDEKRIGSCVGEKEVAQAVEGLGAGILNSILNGEGLD
ncbi:P-loop containing nucleoside triphosphate hydrolase [Glarea lozoyensis ATCC 20868]|uniref:Cell division control protein n=1 Tax=Glarea lozoyensis (strain ATCC 20868 / MF5171) TaxID=1116229 RepID=S3DEH7_GLAL2|nr:P-loop containing nucleoside triphosphate hydrolase [Glarea lozoyensis ATCC 20868]EPE35524.1 P-loop containing nucleoside triphosphate hydrolase [Glarea lozoyensis ATCC 20868]